MNDSKTTLFLTAKRFLSGTLLSRISGVLRDVTMAFAFGTDPSAAALMTAFRLSHLFRRLLGDGAMQMAFIPKFEKLRKEESKAALSFFCGVAFLLSLLLLFLVTLSMIGLYALYGYGGMSQGNSEIIFLTILFMPSLLFICLYGLNCGLLQCEKCYFLPSVAPAAFNLFWIAGAVALRETAAAEAMPWLAGVIVLGCLAQWGATLPKVLSILKAHHYRKQPLSPHIRGFFKPLLLAILGVAASQINNALDPLFARYADSEGPAYLWYAIRIEQLPLALFGVALSGALLPPLSRAIQGRDFIKYKVFLDISIRRCLLFTIPMACACLLAGDTCVNLLFGRGSFSHEAAIATTQCLWGYAIGLPAATLILILAPGFYAMEDYRTPTLITALAVVINIFLNGVFVFAFGYGAFSVALATSISAWANAALLTFALTQKVGSLLFKETLSSLFITMAACGAGALSLYTLDLFLYHGNGMFQIFYGNTPALPRLFSEQLARFLLEATAFGLPVACWWWYDLVAKQETVS